MLSHSAPILVLQTPATCQQQSNCSVVKILCTVLDLLVFSQ